MVLGQTYIWSRLLSPRRLARLFATGFDTGTWIVLQFGLSAVRRIIRDCWNR